MKNKTPKSSPNTASSPHESIITSGHNSNPATPEILAIQPKMENSPPNNRPYDQVLHRQTVLMWGSGNNQTSNDLTSSSPSNTRSPCQTPKPNTHSLGMFSQSNSHSQQHPDKCSKAMDTQSNAHHTKWNGNASSNKEVISIFPIHHNNEAYSQTASTNALHATDSHHSSHHLHRHTGDIANCEVWPSAYSQYQYFSYHHVNAHHQHQASTQ